MTRETAGTAAARRIEALRQQMKQEGISACIIPTDDPHMSEYIPGHYKDREFITGFTGSAGTAVITMEDACLWTDSRYWLQARNQLEGSGVRLFRQGLEDTPSPEDWLCASLPPGSAVSAWGRTLSAARARQLEHTLQTCNIRLETCRNLLGPLWEDRPPLAFLQVRDHPVSYAGMRRDEKLSLIRDDCAGLVAASGAGPAAADESPYAPAGPADAPYTLLLPCLDDIAWLLNLRGSDIPCHPVSYAFAAVERSRVRLYARTDRFDRDLSLALKADGIQLLPYETFYEDLARLENRILILDRHQCNAQILDSLPASARIIDRPSPVMKRKCIKNPVEMNGIRTAHLKDGIAMCRFLCWLKQTAADLLKTGPDASGPLPADRPPADPSLLQEGHAVADRQNTGQTTSLTELSVAEKLYDFRSEQKHFLGNSFDPIVGYGPHGAIVHYSASEETDADLKPRGLLLIDSGGQYPEGTTDITRTIAMGHLTEEEKLCFTAVLRGHIALARAVFPRGCSGVHLDVLAHRPLWELGLDYGHGTGHGVGAYLNVHEDPIRIHWSAKDQPAFAEGMLTSDEPGYYAAGRFGIRHENLLLCVPATIPAAAAASDAPDGPAAAAASDRGFLCFEPVTLVPFDREAILPDLLQPEERNWLNDYHARVYEKIAPHLNEEERSWLREATMPL